MVLPRLASSKRSWRATSVLAIPTTIARIMNIARYQIVMITDSGGRCKLNPPPPPTPYEPQCYNLGESCNTDSDCWQGGTNMCTTCGQYVGNEYYKRCFTPKNMPMPTYMPTKPELGMCGQQCNSDKIVSSQDLQDPPGPPTPPNTCTVCSNLPGCVGCMWQCVDPSEWSYTMKRNL